jgi:hypothetical protein
VNEKKHLPILPMFLIGGGISGDGVGDSEVDEFVEISCHTQALDTNKMSP